MDDSSPYEPVAPNRHPDAFRLASISSGIAGWIFFFIPHLEFSHKRGDICSREGELEVNNYRYNKGGLRRPCINVSTPALQQSTILVVDYLT